MIMRGLSSTVSLFGFGGDSFLVFSSLIVRGAVIGYLCYHDDSLCLNLCISITGARAIVCSVVFHRL